VDSPIKRVAVHLNKILQNGLREMFAETASQEMLKMRHWLIIVNK
jgi:hypothetical protein